ncbi:unnamed protein product [Rhodiola kirilowii]
MTNTIAAIFPAVSSKVQVEGIQSVMPLRPTDPRHTRKVVLKHPQTMGIFQKCHHILLYYKKASEEDSGWVVAGRLKESVGRALLDYPMIAGRLRWGSNDQNASHDHSSNNSQRELELVSNDSGIRLVEAKLPISLDEFLQIKDREQAEGELVYWEELNEENPQFCPLAYIQVTNFECGGYSIGFSLSIVLGDPLELTNFLKHSAKLHKEMFQENKAPVFYLPKLKTNKFFPVPNSSTNPKHVGQTLLYRINNVLNSDKEEDDTILKQLASACFQDSEEKLSTKTELDFALFVKDHKTGDLTVEIGSKKGSFSPPLTAKSSPKFTCTKWGDSHLDDIAFWETHKPTSVAYWIGFRANEGLVMVNPSQVQGSSGRSLDIIVTIPYGK